MVFEFITDPSTVTELQVLVMIYNLLLMMSIFIVCMYGMKYTYMFLRKAVNYNK